MAAVGAVGHAPDLVGVPTERADFPAGVRLPYPDRVVAAARGQGPPVGAEGDAQDPAGVALEGEEFLPGGQPPRPTPSRPARPRPGGGRRG